MRRRTVLVGTESLVGLAGCAAGSDEPGADGTDKGGGGPATCSAEGARTVDHRYGTTTITGVPQRVVSVGVTEQDYLLALGVSSGLTQEEHDVLSKIAPTIAQPSDVDYGATWQELTRTAGTALDRSEAAEAMVTDVEGQLEESKGRLPGDGSRTALLAAVIDDGFQVCSDGPAPQFLASLGLSIPAGAAEAIEAKGGEAAPVSAERFDLLEADVLVLGLYGTDPQTLNAQPTYAALDVVQQDRVVTMTELSRTNVVITSATVLSLPIAIEEMVPRLTTALDGDRATAPAPTEALEE